MSGFNNMFESEAIQGILPQGQNNPQKVEKNLYAELLSGSAFTQPRTENFRTWFYRIRPSVSHGHFQSYDIPLWVSDFKLACPPEQFRWQALDYPKNSKNFIDSMISMSGNGEKGQDGIAIHHYCCNQNMDSTYFFNADGEMLIIPQEGELIISTECGIIELKPLEIAVIPRGMKFKVDLQSTKARGYVGENFGARFRLPNLGPIGSNGLANPRDFLSPLAYYEKNKGNCKLISKFDGAFWQADLKDSPLDVVAWHGNYVPYKYDLQKFNTINTVSFDHPDPSIFTVLTSPTDTEGKANVDFVIFPPRWMVAENTFRPPYYHRNIMSEYMGLIQGVYDAKAEGFVAGGASLHNCFTAHGPDKDTFEKASKADLKPVYQADTMAFMLETNKILRPTEYALNSNKKDLNYIDCWKDLEDNSSL